MMDTGQVHTEDSQRMAVTGVYRSTAHKATYIPSVQLGAGMHPDVHPAYVPSNYLWSGTTCAFEATNLVYGSENTWPDILHE